MTLGAFAVLVALGRRDEAHEDLADWAGVGFRHPVLGLSMAVFMLSLAGIPPTAGFAGKFYVFSAAIDAGDVGLVVIAVLNSVVSVYSGAPASSTCSRRGSSSSRKACSSMRARWAPRQKWTPMPKARW